MNPTASASMRPPTSKPNTRSLHRCAATSSGYTTRRLRWAACCAAEPGACAAPGHAVPLRDTGHTNVVSTATGAPCQSGRPLASTATRRQSASGKPMFMSRKKTLVATRAPERSHGNDTSPSLGQSAGGALAASTAADPHKIFG